MVRAVDHSDGVTLSSIALLQERFRQLEKMKELRQEKELLRMLSKSERSYSPPDLIHHNDTKHTNTCLGMSLVPPKPQCELFLSLWPDSPTKHADSRGISIHHQAPSNIGKSAWFCDAPLVSTTMMNKIEKFESDIDTSLRL